MKKKRREGSLWILIALAERRVLKCFHGEKRKQRRK